MLSYSLPRPTTADWSGVAIPGQSRTLFTRLSATLQEVFASCCRLEASDCSYASGEEKSLCQNCALPSTDSCSFRMRKSSTPATWFEAMSPSIVNGSVPGSTLSCDQQIKEIQRNAYQRKRFVAQRTLVGFMAGCGELRRFQLNHFYLQCCYLGAAAVNLGQSGGGKCEFGQKRNLCLCREPKHRTLRQNNLSRDPGISIQPRLDQFQRDRGQFAPRNANGSEMKFLRAGGVIVADHRRRRDALALATFQETPLLPPATTCTTAMFRSFTQKMPSAPLRNAGRRTSGTLRPNQSPASNFFAFGRRERKPFARSVLRRSFAGPVTTANRCPFQGASPLERPSRTNAG